jgi:5-methylcytosine-specific restriction enzyme A
VTLKPCVQCGEPTDRNRCPQHRPPDRRKVNAAARGYDWQWTKLSKRARRLQPWCTDCGTTEDLQTDHLPTAWERKAAGKPLRLADVEVVCGPCNRARGAARGTTATRGEAPAEALPDPLGKAECVLHTGSM